MVVRPTALKSEGKIVRKRVAVIKWGYNTLYVFPASTDAFLNERFKE